MQVRKKPLYECVVWGTHLAACRFAAHCNLIHVSCYVQRTDGGRYPNSCREKVKGTAACWESRQMALRIPSSTASGTQQRGIGREAENQRQLTVSLTSSCRKHKLPVPSQGLRAKFELRKWNNRWRHTLWTASKKRLCGKKRPKLQLLQQCWRWRHQRQMFTN